MVTLNKFEKDSVMEYIDHNSNIMGRYYIDFGDEFNNLRSVLGCKLICIGDILSYKGNISTLVILYPFSNDAERVLVNCLKMCSTLLNLTRIMVFDRKSKTMENFIQHMPMVCIPLSGVGPVCGEVEDSDSYEIWSITWDSN